MPLAALVLVLSMPMLSLADTKMFFVHNNHLGTPTVITDANQDVVWRLEQKPFGESTPKGIVAEDARFPGQMFDEETGLHYNYFRDYDPTTGRYIQSDPIGLWGGPNTYAYVGSSPMRYTDPLGLITFTVTGNIRIPAWLSKGLNSLGLADIPVNGIEFGIAESFPFFDGAERDSGLLVGADIPGVDIGTGKASMSFGISKGSVCDLPTRTETDFSITVPGLDAGFAVDGGKLSGVYIGPGFGLNIGASGRYSGVYSHKHGFLGPK